MNIRDIVADYIGRYRLLDKDSVYIVAISGGADSVALMLILLELGYRIEAVHCNFRLRGSESDRDETFVRNLCLERGVPFHVVHFDTVEYASLHKISIEMAARQLRYAYFEQLREDIGASAICVAHHRNDSVETLLLNLIRGTGIRGLTGIRPVNGRIIRPLLCISRNDIENYLSVNGQDYVTDSTNLVADVKRNKIRLEILPLMSDINPGVTDCIQRTAEYVAEAVKVFDESIGRSVNEVKTVASDVVIIDVDRLLSQVSPEYVLYEILKDFGFTPQQSERIYSNAGAASGCTYSSADFNLVFDRGRILIARIKAQPRPLVIPETGTYIYDSDKRIRIASTIVDSGFVLSRTGSTVCVDSAKVSLPLTLRPVREGDRFVPFGMRGSKLVSDYLTDRKKNIFQKREQLILEDSTGTAVWLVNERLDNRFRITGSTRGALVISYSKETV